MALPADLDKSGGTPQVRKVYLGPSLGWKYIDAPLYIQHTLSGGSLDIGLGTKPGLTIPSYAIIVAWSLMAIQQGSIVIDIWKTTKTLWTSNTPPTVADRIAGTDRPTLTNQYGRRSVALTGWTTLISQDDVIVPNVDSCSGVKSVTLLIECVTLIGPS